MKRNVHDDNQIIERMNGMALMKTFPCYFFTVYCLSFGCHHRQGSRKVEKEGDDEN